MADFGLRNREGSAGLRILKSAIRRSEICNAMNFDTETRDGVIVVAPRGNVLGGPDGADLHEYLQQQEREGGPRRVVVDLARVQLMNSSGLGMLVSALTSLRNAGGDLRLAAVSERIQSLFVITRLASVFKSYPTVDEAVTSFEEG